jgi:uncharacterized protein YycO
MLQVKAIVLVLALCSAASAADMLPGTVLCSRWNDESQNTSIGHENHLALYEGNGQVIEAQEGRGVIRTPLAEYLARPQSVKRFRPVTPEIGAAAVARTQKFVGQPYGPLASVDPFWRFGRHNCVSVVEQAYRSQTGFVWGVRRPDHIWKLVQ